MSESVTSDDVLKDFASVEEAAAREPVIITRNGRAQSVLMTYAEFVRLSRNDRRADLTSDLDDAEIAAVERSVMAPGHDALDAEMSTSAAE